jgi:phospholipid/cholesterol/gamma-HCH transport system permease protein
VFGLAGSFLVVQLFNSMPIGIYFNNLLQHLTVQDIVITLIKSVAFGTIVSTGAVIEGLSVERASTEVPVAGLRAVGKAFAGCIVVDIFLSAMYYIVMA